MQSRHKVLFLTKSSYIDKLLEIEDHKQAIISFSVNAETVATKWEKAPPPLERINAAARLADEGWDVRIRLDPIVPIPTWRENYSSIIKEIFSKFTPERVTLGTLRGLPTTLRHIRDQSWVRYLDAKGSSWGLKTNDVLREDMYRHVMNELEEHISLKNVGLCKETLCMFERLGLRYKDQVCNCTL